jgi:hypothetical protein
VNAEKPEGTGEGIKPLSMIAHKEDGTYLIGPKGELLMASVAEVWGGKAYADLFVAAPELLEACRDAAKLLAKGQRNNVYAVAAERCLAAISKATGEEGGRG